MLNHYFTLGVLLLSLNLLGQTIDSAQTNNIKTTLGGGIDTYYAYDFNQPESGEIPYYVSSNKHNQFAVNLAYLSLEVKSNRFKFKLMPAFGTYMNANYAAEEGLLKALYEANASIKLLKKKELWLEAGVLNSPYSSESAMSKDQMMYTRSFAPEYVPYYLGGARLNYQLNNKLKLAVAVVNGWQQLKDVNSSKAIGTQVEWKVAKNHLINWNTYVGDERSEANPGYRNRIFNDLYWVYSGAKKWSFVVNGYYGLQEIQNSDSQSWFQLNATSKYKLKNNSFFAARVEYFKDDGVQIRSINANDPFECFGTALGYSVAIQENALLRFELKELISSKGVHFISSSGLPTKNSTIVSVNLSAWF